MKGVGLAVVADEELIILAVSLDLFHRNFFFEVSVGKGQVCFINITATALRFK